MNKIEFLSASLPYDLSIVFKEGSASIIGLDLLNEEVYILYKKHHETDIHIRDVIPIIRPFSDLYKECVQSDYNDGKPFIPIVELAKIAHDGGWTLSTDCYCAISSDHTFHVSNWDFICYDNYYEYEDPLRHFELYQQLIKWHFWPYMKEDENVMYVTDYFNPYK